MTEKTGFESHQSLPLSDKDITVILDSLQDSIEALDRIIGGSSLTHQIRLLLLERQKEMQSIINKLNS